jgi:hypothetical protein
MKEGDLLKVRGEDGAVQYGEMVGINEDDQLEVFYINRSSENRWVWKYDEDWDTVSRNCVLEHIAFDKRNPVEAYIKLGFRPLDEEQFVFLTDTIPDNVLMPVGCFEAEEEDISEDMSDFIVPDEQGEAFTLADPSIPFVKETHELVNKYNDWEPSDANGKKLKTFVDTLADKYKSMDDNRQFAAGKSLDYDHPQLNKK